LELRKDAIFLTASWV